jgi:hypothetical protein
MRIKNIFRRKKEYHLQFDKWSDGNWYINLPKWPFDHSSLMMVAGADYLCSHLSNDNQHTYVSVIPSNKKKDLDGYGELKRTDSFLTGGATYEVSNIPGFSRDIWICPVTLFVLGKYPKYIYIKKENKKN